MAPFDNLEHWESLAEFHGTGDDDYYDLPALIGGTTALRELERRALALAAQGQDLAGLRVAHVQSHIGIDSVLMARLGAEVTAFDFSPTALRRLTDLAANCGVSVRTVLADSQELGSAAFAEFHGQFDIVYATIGVVSWIADLDAWMRGVAALLRPGGRLALLELHPLICMFDTAEPLVADFPYASDGVRHYEGTGSYANPQADISWRIDQFAWSIGETVMAGQRAGLRLVHLEEHVAAPFDPRGGLLTKEDDGLYRLRLGVGVGGAPAEPLPVLFTLVAERS